MAWETRSGTRRYRYYTRSRRLGDRVMREYVGGGLAGRLAAEADEEERRLCLEQHRRANLEREALEAMDRQSADVFNAVDVLVRAVLVSEGYHRHHRGEWRKKDGKGKNRIR